MSRYNVDIVWSDSYSSSKIDLIVDEAQYKAIIDHRGEGALVIKGEDVILKILDLKTQVKRFVFKPIVVKTELIPQGTEITLPEAVTLPASLSPKSTFTPYPSTGTRYTKTYYTGLINSIKHLMGKGNHDLALASLQSDICDSFKEKVPEAYNELLIEALAGVGASEKAQAMLSRAALMLTLDLRTREYLQSVIDKYKKVEPTPEESVGAK